MSQYSFIEPVKPKKNKLGLILSSVLVFILAIIIAILWSRPIATENILPDENNQTGGETVELLNITLSDKSDNEYDSLMREGTGLTYIANISEQSEALNGAVYKVEHVDTENLLNTLITIFNVSGETHTKTFENGTQTWVGGIVEDEWIDYNQKSVSVASYNNSTSWTYNKGYGDITNFTGEYVQYDVDTAVNEVKTIMLDLGYIEDDYNLVVDNEYYVQVKVEFILEGEVSPLSTDFLFDENGLQSAAGYAVGFKKVGDYEILSAEETVVRLGKPEYATFTAASIFNKYFVGNINQYDYPEYSEHMFMYYGHSEVGETTVTISKYEKSWVSLTDVDGDTYIVKGYLLVSEQGNNIIYAVPALPDNMLTIVRGNS